MLRTSVDSLGSIKCDGIVVQSERCGCCGVVRMQVLARGSTEQGKK